jgi:hypothetical protein
VALASLLAFLPLAIRLLAKSGYESARASVEAPQMLEGWHSMLARLGYRWIQDLWPIADWMWPYALLLFGIVMGAIAALGWSRTSPHTRHALDPGLPVMVLGCVAVVVLGYVPYSFTDIRLNEGRALMGSRLGAVLLLVSVATAAWDRFAAKGRAALPLAHIPAALLITLFALNKLELFDARHQRTVYQKVFLSDLAVQFPCLPSDVPILVVHAAGEFGRDTDGGTLLTRPVYPIQVVFGNRSLQVLSVNAHVLRRFGSADPGERGFTFRGRRIDGNPLLLEYSYASGITHLDRIVLPVGANRTLVALEGAPLPGESCIRAPLVNALRGRNQDYLAKLGIERTPHTRD